MGSTASSTKQESCLLRQAGFHLSTDGADIGTPLNFWLQDSHDFTHVSHNGSTTFSDGLLDQGGNFVCGQLLWQELLQHNDLGGLFVGKILATGSFKLADGIATLFDHFGHDSEDLFIIELDTGIDFTLLDFCHQQADSTQPRLVFGKHGELLLILELILQRHGMIP